MQDLNLSKYTEDHVYFTMQYYPVGDRPLGVASSENFMPIDDFKALIESAMPKGVSWNTGNVWTSMFGLSTDKIAKVNQKITRGGIELVTTYKEGPLYMPTSYEVSLKGVADFSKEDMAVLTNAFDFVMAQVCGVPGRGVNTKASLVIATPNAEIHGQHLTVICDALYPPILDDDCRDVLVLSIK